jgi:hypothetical protein
MAARCVYLHLSKDIEGILWVLESLGVPNKKSRRN